MVLELGVGGLGGGALEWVVQSRTQPLSTAAIQSGLQQNATPTAGKAKPGKPTGWQWNRGFYMPHTTPLAHTLSQLSRAVRGAWESGERTYKQLGGN